MPMRFLLGIFLLLVLAPLSFGALIDQWTFDETGGTTVADSVGSHNGTVNGSVNFVAGKFGNAIDLSGSNNWVDFGDNFSFTTGPFSITFWLKTLDNDVDQVVVSRHEATVVAGYLVGINGSACDPQGNNCSYGAPGDAWFYTGSQAHGDVTNSTTVTDGNWHLIAAVVNGNAHLSVDGGPFAVNSLGSLSSIGVTFMAGGLHNSSGIAIDAYSGLLDDLRIYSNALTQGDVEGLYNGSAVPEPASIVLAMTGLGFLILRRALLRR
jgi:hypothetical protein